MILRSDSEFSLEVKVHTLIGYSWEFRVYLRQPIQENVML